MICKNCGHSVDGNFCENCGQSTKIERINGRTFFDHFVQSVFQVDRGFFYTLKQLSLRPGQCIKDYLEGKRRLCFNPISYALLLSTVYFLLSKLLGAETYISDFLLGFSNASDGDEKDDQVLQTLKWFAENYAYTVLVLLPIYAISSFIMFRKSRFSYLEHVVINTFVTGHQALIYMVSAVIGFIAIQNDILVLITILSSMTYGYWTFSQLFSEYGKVSVLFRFLLTYLISILIPSGIAAILIVSLM